MKKTYISANKLLHDSFTLASMVVESGYRPTFLIGLWRGGAPIAIAVHEYITAMGIECDHIAVRTQSYTGIDKREKTIKIDGLEYIENNLKPEDRLLIVDDVHDTGLSMATVIKEISEIASPKEIKVATAYFKPNRNQVDFSPDFYIEETDQWLVFPHELVGLTKQELANKKFSFKGEFVSAS